MAPTDIHCYLLKGCEHSEAMGDMFQQRQQWQWDISAGAGFDKHGMEALVHLCENLKSYFNFSS